MEVKTSTVPSEPLYAPVYNSIMCDAGAFFLKNHRKYLDMLDVFFRKAKLQAHIPASSGIFLQYLLRCVQVIRRDEKMLAKVSHNLMSKEDILFCFDFILADDKFLKLTSNRIAKGRYNNRYVQSETEPLDIPYEKSVKVYSGCQHLFQNQVLYQVFSNLTTQLNRTINVLNVGAGEKNLLGEWLSKYGLCHKVILHQLDMYGEPKPHVLAEKYQLHYIQDDFVSFVKKGKYDNFDLVLFMDSIYYVPVPLDTISEVFKCPVVSFNFVFDEELKIYDNVEVKIDPNGRVLGRVFEWALDEHLIELAQFRNSGVMLPQSFVKVRKTKNEYVNRLLFPYYRFFHCGLDLHADVASIPESPPELPVCLLNLFKVDGLNVPTYKSVLLGNTEDEDQDRQLRVGKTHYVTKKADGIGAFMYGGKNDKMTLQFKDGVILQVSAKINDGKDQVLYYDCSWPVLYIEVFFHKNGYMLYFNDVVVRSKIDEKLEKNFLVGYSLLQTLRFIQYVNKLNCKVVIGTKRYERYEEGSTFTGLLKDSDLVGDGVLLVPHYPLKPLIDDVVMCVKEISIFDIFFDFNRYKTRKDLEVYISNMVLPDFPRTNKRSLVLDFALTRVTMNENGEPDLKLFDFFGNIQVVYETAIGVFPIEDYNKGRSIFSEHDDFVFTNYFIFNQTRWLRDSYENPQQYVILFIPLLPRPDKSASQCPSLHRSIVFTGKRVYKNFHYQFCRYLEEDKDVGLDFRKLIFCSTVPLKNNGMLMKERNDEQKRNEKLVLNELLKRVPQQVRVEFGQFSIQVKLERSLYYYDFVAPDKLVELFLDFLIDNMSVQTNAYLRSPHLYERVKDFFPNDLSDDVFYFGKQEATVLINKFVKDSLKDLTAFHSPLIKAILFARLEKFSGGCLMLPAWKKHSENNLMYEYKGFYSSKIEIQRALSVLKNGGAYQGEAPDNSEFLLDD